MAVRYYREDTGDFLMVIFDREYRNTDGSYSARAAAITGNASSVCTTNVSKEYLKEHCTLVRKAEVSSNWLNRF